MATSKKQPAQSMAVPVIAVGTIGAGVLIYLGLPGMVLVWLAVYVAAWMEVPPPLTGKKDWQGYPTAATPTEEAAMISFRFFKSLRHKMILPGPWWLPGWPPLGYWLATVAVSTLMLFVPTGVPQWLDLGPETDPVMVAALFALANVVATFMLGTAVFSSRRKFAGNNCPGTRVNALIDLLRTRPQVTIPVILAGPVVLFGALFGLQHYYPDAAAITDRLPVWALVLAGLLAAGLAIGPLWRDKALGHWRVVEAAREQWRGRWAALKQDPAPTLVDRLVYDSVTVDIFDAPDNPGAAGMLPLGPKLTPGIGSGARVCVLGHPVVENGQPVPGSADPTRFRVLAWNNNQLPDVKDPATDPDIARMFAESALSWALDAGGWARLIPVEIEKITTDEATSVVWVSQWTSHLEITAADLRRHGMNGPVGAQMKCDVSVDHRTGRMFFGDFKSQGPFVDIDADTTRANGNPPDYETAIRYLDYENVWDDKWSTGSLTKHKANQPTPSHQTTANAALANGAVVHRQAFVTRNGVDPYDYFGQEGKLKSSLDGAPFVAITGWHHGGRPGDRHSQAFCVYYSSEPVPGTLDKLNPGTSRSQAPQWVISGIMNKAFRAVKLRIPEVVKAAPMTDAASRKAIWQVQLRLHDGVTIADVRAKSEALRQDLGVDWLRVADAPDGVTIYAGGKPSAVKLVNPHRTMPKLVSLDWEQVWLENRLVGSERRLPKLINVGTLPFNTDIQVLDFELPPGLDPTRIKTAVRKLRSSTDNAFVEVRPTPGNAKAVRLMVCKEDPLPRMAPFDFEAAEQSNKKMLLATNVDGEPVGVDFMEGAHLLVVGGQGSGKSSAAQGLLYSSLVNGYEVAVLDVMKKAVDFEFLRDRARGFATELEDAAALIQAVYAEGARRIGLNAKYKTGHSLKLPEEVRPPRFVLFIDEFTSLLGKEPVPAKSDDLEAEKEREEALRINSLKSTIGRFAGKIAREQRAAGISLVLATQKMDTKTLDGIPGSSDLKDQLARALLGAASEGLRMSSLRNPFDAPDLGEVIPPGRGLWEPLTATRAVQIQGWFADQGTEEGRFDPGTFAYELAERVPAIDPVDRLDLAPYLAPVSDESDEEFGPPPDFGQTTDVPGEAVVEETEMELEPEVIELEEISLDLDLDDDTDQSPHTEQEEDDDDSAPAADDELAGHVGVDPTTGAGSGGTPGGDDPRLHAARPDSGAGGGPDGGVGPGAGGDDGPVPDLTDGAEPERPTGPERNMSISAADLADLVKEVEDDEQLQGEAVLLYLMSSWEDFDELARLDEYDEDDELDFAIESEQTEPGPEPETMTLDLDEPQSTPASDKPASGPITGSTAGPVMTSQGALLDPDDPFDF